MNDLHAGTRGDLPIDPLGRVQAVNGDAVRIDDPVVGDTRACVALELRDRVVAAVARAGHLHDEVHGRRRYGDVVRTGGEHQNVRARPVTAVELDGLATGHKHVKT